MLRHPRTIKALTQGFAEHIRELKGPDYKEQQVRAHYIDPFWKLLGWDIDNSEQRAPHDVEVQVEPSLATAEDDGLRAREPDYLFRANGFPRFIVEAKKPAIDIDTDKKAIFQAKRYAWNASIPFAILTDFEQFRLYDATLKPVLGDPTRGLIKDFVIDFQDYPTRWSAIADTFGRDAVADGSLEALLAKVKKIKAGRRVRSVDRLLIDVKGAEPVDRVFLDYLEKFRQHFANAIYRDNKSAFPDAESLHGAARLTEAVQRLIDRLVFMRVCEDRGVAEYGSLRDTLERISWEGGDLYRSLCADFRELDREYNGYLFKFHFSEELQVPGDTLADFIRTLYPPDGPWDFARIGDDILAIVYERFLGSTVSVRGGNAIVEEKPEVRHAGGVYYTPHFVVDAIIRRALGPKLERRAPTDVLDLKVLDPACGSGSFLVAAFQYLMDHCEAAIEANPELAAPPRTSAKRTKAKDIAFRDNDGKWHLAPDFRAALLTNCIHGVDIDQQAVEVTVMSLYLKMLEGRLPPNWQRDWLENELLPPLDANVMCGNSLIDEASYDAYLSTKRGALFGEDADTRFRINRFDWRSRTRGFGRLVGDDAMRTRGRSGFDCIIGNPPYIRVQELNKWAPEECLFYRWKYRSAKKGNYDIYVVFTERCLELLAPDGLIGFIMPHKFWQAQYGEGLRDVITGGEHLKSIIDFGDQQVFRGATTYTAIHFLSKKPVTKPVEYAKVLELVDGDTQCRAIERGESIQNIVAFAATRPTSSSVWTFSDSASTAIRAHLADQGPPLIDFAKRIFVGIQTSADRVFILERRDERYFSQHLQSFIDIEDVLLHPLLKGSVHMKKWVPLASSNFVLFPYQRGPTGFDLIDANELQSTVPRTWDYLLRCREELAKRERGTFEGDRWYGYVYPKNLASMSEAKILTPSLAQHAEFSLDESGDYFFVGSGGGGGGGYGILLDRPSQFEYILGLLNSRLLDWFLKQITTPFHSGWYAYNKQFIEQLPIKLPKSKADRELAEQITLSVRSIRESRKKLLSEMLSDRERHECESVIDHHERRIDDTVCALYGISPHEPPY